MLRGALITAALLGLTGCGSIPIVGAIHEPGPDKIALAVDQYCKRISAGGRSAFRDRVNAESEPHSVYIWCHGNPPPWLDDARWVDWTQSDEGMAWHNQMLNEVTQ